MTEGPATMPLRRRIEVTFWSLNLVLALAVLVLALR